MATDDTPFMLFDLADLAESQEGDGDERADASSGGGVGESRPGFGLADQPAAVPATEDGGRWRAWVSSWEEGSGGNVWLSLGVFATEELARRVLPPIGEWWKRTRVLPEEERP